MRSRLRKAYVAARPSAFPNLSPRARQSVATAAYPSVSNHHCVQLFLWARWNAEVGGELLAAPGNYKDAPKISSGGIHRGLDSSVCDGLFSGVASNAPPTGGVVFPLLRSTAQSSFPRT